MPTLPGWRTLRPGLACVTNGTSVLGLGGIGPLDGKPVMEGKGCLLQKFAGIERAGLRLKSGRVPVHSTCGSSRRPSALKMRAACDLFVAHHPDVSADGEDDGWPGRHGRADSAGRERADAHPDAVGTARRVVNMTALALVLALVVANAGALTARRNAA